VAAKLGPFYHLVRNLYWVDELYERLVLRTVYLLSHASAWFDRWIVDGAVNGARHITLGLSFVSNAKDRWIVDGLVNLTAVVTQSLHKVFSKVQTGFVQSYASVMIFGVLVLIVFYTLVK
jgi:NADH-quinone oxidoreductase subunit L